MVLRFDGTANASSFKTIIRISPEQVEIGGLMHDNLWPDESPIGYVPDEQAPKEAETEQEPGALNILTNKAIGLLEDFSKQAPDVGTVMVGDKDEPPFDPGRTPDKPDRPFDPSRTPDYPSADKPTLPTIADRIDTLETIAELLFPDEEPALEQADPQEVERITKRNEEIRLATEGEKERLEKIREEFRLKSKNKRRKNVAYAEGQITDKDGNIIDYEAISISGEEVYLALSNPKSMKTNVWKPHLHKAISTRGGEVRTDEPTILR